MSKTQPIGCPYCGSLIDERTGWTCPACIHFSWGALIAIAFALLVGIAALA